MCRMGGRHCGQTDQVSKGTQVPKCEVSVHSQEPRLSAVPEWEMGQELIAKVHEGQAKDDGLYPQAKGSH